MRGFGWQDAAVALMALAALAWLVRRRRRAARRLTPLCDDCPGCTPAASPPASGRDALIPASDLLRRDR